MKDNSLVGGISITSKMEIRKRVIADRDALPEYERGRYSNSICDRLTSLDEYNRAQVILFFASFGSEVSLWGAIKKAWQDGKQVLLPKTVQKTGELHIYEVKMQEALIPGKWGILEPDPTHCTRVGEGKVDLVIIPGVAFDSEGNRLGYGKGYYDRLLPHMRKDVPRIAVGFHVQLVDHVPTEPHDEKLDALITEQEIIRFH